MTPDKAHRLIRAGAMALMIPVAVQLVYFAQSAFRRAWQFSFARPEWWDNHWRLDTYTQIGMTDRATFFIFWTIVILLSMLCFVIGLLLLNRVRQGRLLEEGTARLLQALGIALAVAMIVDQAFQGLSPWLLTATNEVRDPIYFAYDPSDYKSLTLAVVMIFLGVAVRRGLAIAAENQRYV